jgi:hypothetical protein
LTDWDNFDKLGRDHYRLLRIASRGMRDAKKRLDESTEGEDRAMAERSYANWDISYNRHAHEILLLMQFERLVMLDLGIDKQTLHERMERKVSAQ